jgi:hypothetical protein
MQALFSSSSSSNVRRASAQPQQYRSSVHRNIAALASADAIEWEELPSLARTVAERRQMPTVSAAARAFTPSTFGNAWSATERGDLHDLPAPQAFHEPLRGMAVREVHEPEVFSHFFGEASVVAGR